ncbi:putative ankyrin repeat protein [Chloropicon roscoffensis]|uniref:Ankyrin repeat protein n=1 Tax=Chloropicon roscoffensis TaxID=1461544 RepID=A0AAX4PCW5_9CHLO
MARGEGEPSTKRAKVGEEEDPLVRRKEEVVRLLGRARKGKSNARAKKELVTLCADFEAKNEKLLGRLPPELWQKILDEYLHQNDLLALAMTCRFFREKQKDLGKKVDTYMNSDRLLEQRKSGKMLAHSLGWFRWVCDTLKVLPGFTWSYKSLKGAVYEGNLVNYAAFQGSVEVLKWLVEEKYWELNLGTGEWAGRGGSIEVLEYLCEEGWELDEGVCDGAALGGHLEVLKFLRGLDPPCPWDWETCQEAAEGGHLEVLKWVRDQDPPCPLDELNCAAAAGGGHLEVLKWLRDQDPPCPWDWETCAWAAEGGQLEVLKWARSQDPPCPWSRSWCRETASRHGHQHIVDWIDQREDESDVEPFDSDTDRSYGDDYF